MGVTGEDNTYGRGMIDVMAAFNYMAQTHTPTPPLSKKYDIAVTEISNINLPFYCTKTFTPQIIISNLGDSTLYNAKIYYRLNNETQHIQNWTGNLQ